MKERTNNFAEFLDGIVLDEVARVGDLLGSPFTFVGRVLDHGGLPFALVVGVGLVRAITRPVRGCTES